MTSARSLLFVAAASAAALGSASQALAHTPYLLPNTFDAERQRVTIQAAQTEDDYFNPDIGLQMPVYLETLPSGQQAEIKPAIALKDLAVVEAPLDAAGTYRFSTGQFAMRKADLAFVGGKWMYVRDKIRPGGDGPPNVILATDVPADAKKMTTEGVMVAETYVSKGTPTKAALAATGKGFELTPVDHPNALYVDQGFGFELTVDGKPFPNAQISLYREGNVYDDKRIAQTLKTDAKGAARIRFDQPGVYLITTHYPAADIVPGEAPPPQTYTYSLTFEVTR
jgi:hypothetical protein